MTSTKCPYSSTQRYPYFCDSEFVWAATQESTLCVTYLSVHVSVRPPVIYTPFFQNKQLLPEPDSLLIPRQLHFSRMSVPF